MALLKGGCRLSSLLAEINMSPAEFARRMGVNESAVSRWINNQREMHYNHAVLAARILNCHAEDIYEWIEDKRH